MTLREMLLRDEGKRLRPYPDQYGFTTIGVGRNLDAVGISDDECDLMFTNDINRFQTAVASKLPWTATLSEPRRAVLIGMAFNMGTGGLLGFRQMLAAAEAGRWEEAAVHLLDSRYATQVPERAARYAQQLCTGDWV